MGELTPQIDAEEPEPAVRDLSEQQLEQAVRLAAKKRGLTVAKAAFLIEKLFPSIEHANNTDKGAFLHLLTGLRRRRLKDSFGDGAEYSPGKRECGSGVEEKT